MGFLAAASSGEYNPKRLKLEDLLIHENDCIQGLGLRTGRQVTLCHEMVQKGFNMFVSPDHWVSLVVD